MNDVLFYTIIILVFELAKIAFIPFLVNILKEKRDLENKLK